VKYKLKMPEVELLDRIRNGAIAVTLLWVSLLLQL